MPPPRRFGSANSEVRTRFIDAAEELLADTGEHGVSARSVAARADLKTQLLYYYFRTMDDLLSAVVHRVNERRALRFEEALTAPEPLRALWQAMIDPSAAALAAELSAVAKHRIAVREEIVRSARAFRIYQTKVVSALLQPEDRDSAAGIVMIAAALARMIVNENALGLTEGHVEAAVIVESLLARNRSG